MRNLNVFLFQGSMEIQEFMVLKLLYIFQALKL